MSKGRYFWLPRQHSGVSRMSRASSIFVKIFVSAFISLVIWFSGALWVILPRRLAEWLKWWRAREDEVVTLNAENKRAEARFAEDLRQRPAEERFWKEFWGTEDGRPPGNAPLSSKRRRSND